MCIEGTKVSDRRPLIQTEGNDEISELTLVVDHHSGRREFASPR